MSLRLDGHYRCDRCGHDVGNAAATEAAMLSTTDQAGAAVRLHFCRNPNPGAPQGCADHLLTPAKIANYLATRDTPPEDSP